MTIEKWNGRIDSRTDREEYRLHQIVQTEFKQTEDFALVGFVCDEGVRRNKGRVGAREAPDELRAALSNLPANDFRGFVDLGNVYCENTQLEPAQQRLGEKVQEIIHQNTNCIVLGGGHETLYGHYLGLRQAYGKDRKIGLVNIDAHFDLRDYEDQPTSGTMFKQILDSDENAAYFVCGIQRTANTKKLFKRAQEKNVVYFLEDEMTLADIVIEFETFAQLYDVILFTLCMDAIEASHAPGVSAPSSFGLHPKLVRELIQRICHHEKTTHFNICEINPSLDSDRRTIRLGAQFIYEAARAMKE